MHAVGDMRWSLVDRIRRTLFGRHADTPPAVTDEERRAVEDAISHSTQARTRSDETITRWERATAGAWGYRRTDG